MADKEPMQKHSVFQVPSPTWFDVAGRIIGNPPVSHESLCIMFQRDMSIVEGRRGRIVGHVLPSTAILDGKSPGGRAVSVEVSYRIVRLFSHRNPTIRRQ